MRGRAFPVRQPDGAAAVPRRAWAAGRAGASPVPPGRQAAVRARDGAEALPFPEAVRLDEDGAAAAFLPAAHSLRCAEAWRYAHRYTRRPERRVDAERAFRCRPPGRDRNPSEHYFPPEALLPLRKARLPAGGAPSGCGGGAAPKSRKPASPPRPSVQPFRVRSSKRQALRKRALLQEPSPEPAQAFPAPARLYGDSPSEQAGRSAWGQRRPSCGNPSYRHWTAVRRPAGSRGQRAPDHRRGSCLFRHSPSQAASMLRKDPYHWETARPRRPHRTFRSIRALLPERAFGKSRWNSAGRDRNHSISCTPYHPWLLPRGTGWLHKTGTALPASVVS